MLIVFFSVFSIFDVDARCSDNYPCRGSTQTPLAVDYWKQSDTVVLGKVVSKLYDSNAFDNFDHNNYKNPCNLDDKSKYVEPFKVRIEVEKSYKGMVFFKYLDVYGTKIIDERQFSKGYVINPEIGEQVLLYMNYHESIPFGSCDLKNIYKVHSTQGSIWKWNFDDYKPDIYPGDVKIPPFEEQLLHYDVSDHYQNYTRVGIFNYERLVCPLGEELMFKSVNPNDVPFCIHYKDAPRLEQIGFAFRVHDWDSWNTFGENFYDESKEYSYIKPFNFPKDLIMKYDSYPINEKLKKILSKITIRSDETKQFEKLKNIDDMRISSFNSSIMIMPDGLLHVPLDNYKDRRFFIDEFFNEQKPLWGYEKYFPKQIPSGYELKFIKPAQYLYEDVIAVYAPISVNIETSDSFTDIFQQNGIVFRFTNDGDYFEHLRKLDQLWGNAFPEIPSQYGVSGVYDKESIGFDPASTPWPNMKIDYNPNTVYVEFPNKIMVKIESFGVDTFDLMDMMNIDNSFKVKILDSLTIDDLDIVNFVNITK